MSVDRCSVCENVVDTDDYPEGYYDAKDRTRDKYICRWCDPSDEESDTAPTPEGVSTP